MARHSRHTTGSGQHEPTAAYSQSLVPDPAEPFRDSFRKAFEYYIREGDSMNRLLLSRDGPRTPEHTAELHAQQRRLTEARERYDRARRAYVAFILGSSNETDPT